MSWEQEWQSITNSPQYQQASDSDREAERNEFFNQRIAPHFSPYEEAEAKQYWDEYTAPQGNPDATFIGESYNLLKSGLLGSAADTAQGISFGHSNRVADWLRQGADEAMQQVSPSMLEAIADTGIEYDKENGLSIMEDSSFRGLYGHFMQGTGSLGTSLAVGGALGKAVGLAGRAGASSAVAGRVMSGSDKSIKALVAKRNYDNADRILKAADIGTRVGNRVGFGGMGSAMMVGGVASEGYETMMQMPDEELRQLEPFQNLVQEELQNYPDNPAMAEAAARERLAKDVSLNGRLMSGALGFITGNISNPMEARMLMGKGSTRRLGNIFRGGMAETTEEFAQSASQKLQVNRAQMEVAQRDMDLMDGVIGEALTSAVVGGMTGAALGAASRPSKIATKEDYSVQIGDTASRINALREDLETNDKLDPTERDQKELELARKMRELRHYEREFQKAPTEEQVARRRKGKPDPESDTGENQPASGADGRNWIYPDIDARYEKAGNDYRKILSDYTRATSKGGDAEVARNYEISLAKKKELIRVYDLLRKNVGNQQFFESKETFDDWIDRLSMGGETSKLAQEELRWRKAGRPLQEGMLNIRRQVEGKVAAEREALRPKEQPPLKERLAERRDEVRTNIAKRHFRGMRSLQERAAEKAPKSRALAVHKKTVAYKKTKAEQDRRLAKERDAAVAESERRRVQKLMTDKVHFKQQNIGRYQVWPVGKEKFAVGGIDPAESGAMNKLGGSHDQSGTWSFPRQNRMAVLSALESMARKPQPKRKPAQQKTYPKTERKQQRRQKAAAEKSLRKTLADLKAKRESDKQFNLELLAERVRPAARKKLLSHRKAIQDATNKRISDLQKHINTSFESIFEKASEQSREHRARKLESEEVQRGMAAKQEKIKQQARRQEQREQAEHQSRLDNRHWQQVKIGPYDVWAAAEDAFVVSGALKSDSAKMRDLGGFFNKTLGSWQFPKDKRFEVEAALQQMAKQPRKAPKPETFSPSEKERRKNAASLEHGRRKYVAERDPTNPQFFERILRNWKKKTGDTEFADLYATHVYRNPETGEMEPVQFVGQPLGSDFGDVYIDHQGVEITGRDNEFTPIPGRESRYEDLLSEQQAEKPKAEKAKAKAKHQTIKAGDSVPITGKAVYSTDFFTPWDGDGSNNTMTITAGPENVEIIIRDKDRIIDQINVPRDQFFDRMNNDDAAFFDRLLDQEVGAEFNAENAQYDTDANFARQNYHAALGNFARMFGSGKAPLSSKQIENRLNKWQQEQNVDSIAGQNSFDKKHMLDSLTEGDTNLLNELEYYLAGEGIDVKNQAMDLRMEFDHLHKQPIAKRDDNWQWRIDGRKAVDDSLSRPVEKREAKPTPKPEPAAESKPTKKAAVAVREMGKKDSPDTLENMGYQQIEARSAAKRGMSQQRLASLFETEYAGKSPDQEYMVAVWPDDVVSVWSRNPNNRQPPKGWKDYGPAAKDFAESVGIETKGKTKSALIKEINGFLDKQQEKNESRKQIEEHNKALEAANKYYQERAKESEHKERFKNKFESVSQINDFLKQHNIAGSPEQNGLSVKGNKDGWFLVDDNGWNLTASELTAYVDQVKESGFKRYKASERLNKSSIGRINNKNLKDKDLIGTSRGDPWNKKSAATINLKKHNLQDTHYVSGERDYFYIRKKPDLSGIEWEHVTYSDSNGNTTTMMVPKGDLTPDQRDSIIDMTGEKFTQFRRPAGNITDGMATPKKDSPVIRLKKHGYKEFEKLLADTKRPEPKAPKKAPEPAGKIKTVDDLKAAAIKAGVREDTDLSVRLHKPDGEHYLSIDDNGKKITGRLVTIGTHKAVNQKGRFHYGLVDSDGKIHSVDDNETAKLITKLDADKEQLLFKERFGKYGLSRTLPEHNRFSVSGISHDQAKQLKKIGGIGPDNKSTGLDAVIWFDDSKKDLIRKLLKEWQIVDENPTGYFGQNYQRRGAS